MLSRFIPLKRRHPRKGKTLEKQRWYCDGRVSQLKLTGIHNWILLDPTGEVYLLFHLFLTIYPHGISSFVWIPFHPSMHAESWCLNTADPMTPRPHSLFRHLAQVLSPDTSSRFTSMRTVQVMTKEGAQLTQFSSGFDFGFPLVGNV